MVGIRVLPCLLGTWNHLIALWCDWVDRWLSGSEGYFGSEDVLLEETLLDELF